MNRVRALGFGLLAVVAVAVFVAAAPDSAGTGGEEDFARQVSAAVARGELNEANADSAPQQQVVNGWVAADLLEISALAQAELVEGARTAAPVDDRTPALLLVGVLALMWHGATLPQRASSEGDLRWPAPVPAPEATSEAALINESGAPMES